MFLFPSLGQKCIIPMFLKYLLICSCRKKSVYDSDTTGVYEFAIYPETDFGWKSCICYNCEYEHLIWYEATSLVTQLFVKPV